ncbi:MAG: outer membrane beta-barrel protein [Campylobacterota bacterium]|nr:outer membrane beta-barrel protein [Campylobacterota bacterium]
MKNKNKILTLSKKLMLSGVLLATISSNSYAGQGALTAGYTSASSGGVSTSGVSVGYGAYFGDTYKQSIGFTIDFLGENNSYNEEKGNLGNIYYNLGYEILPDTIAYATIGYGFQALGSSAYATGLSSGVGIQYEINKNFSIDAGYKNFDLSNQDLKYDIKTTNLSLVFKY